jgi:hypothetical protein
MATIEETVSNKARHFLGKRKKLLIIKGETLV